jgi:hypothetical protein
MCEGSRIDDNEISPVVRGSLNPANEFVFGIALEIRKRHTGHFRLVTQPLQNLIKRSRSVMSRLTHAKQIQVWAIQYKYF